MALRVVLLCTEDRCGLKYPFKHADHHLFVELRTLCEHGRSVEIVELEDVGSALGTLTANLRGVDLREMLAVQEITETAHDAFLDPELYPLTDVAERGAAVVELCLQ